MGNGALYLEEEYWIDGYFIPWWSGKSYFSHDRSIFVPKFATVRVEANRIYINREFVLQQTKRYNAKGGILDWSNKEDAFLGLFIKALNVPWEKEPVVEREQRFKVSLP